MTKSADLLISIVVPSYNQPEFVADCLESICRQTGPSFEIILIDGGSNAATLAKIAPFRPKLAYFVSEKDRGQSHAINKGLKVAKGRMVTWLNTDDFLLPGALAAMAEGHRRNPAAPFYLGRGFRTDRDGKTRVPFYPEKFHFSLEALIWGLNFVLQPATFINRRALEAAGGSVDEHLHFAMDTDLWLRLAKQGEPEWVPGDIACSREYASTKTSAGGWKRVAEIQRVAQHHSGATLTPGVLAEVCRQLLECSEQPEVSRRFPPELRQSIINLWGNASRGLTTLCHRDDGLPVKP